MTSVILEKAMTILRSSAQRMSVDRCFRHVFEEYEPMDREGLLEWQSEIRDGLGQPEYAIPPAISELYRVTGGFRFQWQYRSDSGGWIAGSAQLAGLVELYQRDEEADLPISELIATPRVFDAIGKDEFVKLRLDHNGGQARLDYFDEEAGVSFPLDLDPVRYVVALAEHRAIHGWQALFSASPSPDEAAASRLRADVDRLFNTGRE